MKFAAFLVALFGIVLGTAAILAVFGVIGTECVSTVTGWQCS